MKQSYYTTPRNLAECTFDVGYAEAESPYEIAFGYVLAFAIGVGMAMLLVACSDRKDDADAERQKKLHDMYKTPLKSDRSKDKGF